MMFDWDDPDQVGETIWGEFKESEDHIVPYPKDTEQHPVFIFEECNNKQRNDNVSTIPQSTGQSSGARNEFPGCRLVNSSSLNTNEDHSGPKLEMDTWPDLLSLNAELSTGYNNGNNQDSLEMSKMMGVRQDKENDSFLDCDWANIGDFDDLDKIFRSESVFGHDMVTNVDELLSSSADMIGITMQSIPMPDIPLTRDKHSDQGCSSSQLVEHSGGKRKVEDKTADTSETREQAFPQVPHSHQLSETGDRKKKLLKSHKKAEERGKIVSSQLFNVPWPQNIGQNQQFPGQNVNPLVITSSQTIPSPAQAQHSKVCDAELMENIGLPSQFIYSQYGYPAYPFPGMPVLQHVQADSHRRNDVPIGNYPDPLKYANNSNMLPEIQSKPLVMTPQEKIEKLRRRQQAQALLAIQKHQQLFGRQITSAEDMVCQENYQMMNGQEAVKSDIGVEENENKLPASDINLLLLQDSSQRISTLTDDNSSEKTIYQLQDSMRKLDIRVRLCIRDSLFRLAKSSMERQNASDRSSTNKSTRDEYEASVHEEANIGKRHTLPDAEAYTNPIDRTVAQLLFHRPSESCTRRMNDELPRSPSLHIPVPILPQNVHGCVSEGEPESFGEMDLQTSESR